MGSLRIENTIVALNTGSSSGFQDVYTTSSYANGKLTGKFNLIGNDPNVFGVEEKNRVNVDPLLSELGDHGGPTQTYLLREGSPAIDVSTNLIDQRGYRISGATVVGDIGATQFIDEVNVSRDGTDDKPTLREGTTRSWQVTSAGPVRRPTTLTARWPRRVRSTYSD